MNRDIEILSFSKNNSVEIVERKGLGHPDTLSDLLGEHLSVAYSQYTRERFGAILHHNFDKVSLLGGKSEVSFGKGSITSPIRILLNGRASGKFGDTTIPVKELLIEECNRFMKDRFPMLEVEKDIHIIYEVSTGGSPGAVDDNKSKRHYWFEPRSLKDLPELQSLNCNDTSMGCAFAPYTKLEALVLNLELKLNSEEYKRDKPWVGNDIKIMAQRFYDKVFITMAFPQISLFVSSLEEYQRNIEQVYEDVYLYCKNGYPHFDIDLSINTRDKYSSLELYLTYTGSSIETGDEGVVGRGNRIGGLITPVRPYTMEGICGKNPVYHTGKMYSVAAYEIAWDIYNDFDYSSEVFLIGQSGQSLINPWKTIVRLGEEVPNKDEVLKVVESTLECIPSYTEKILSKGYRLS